MLLIFALPLFAVGAILGIVVLLACIAIVSGKALKAPRRRVIAKPAPTGPNVRFSTSVPLQWMNKLLWVAYPSFVSLQKLKQEIRSAFTRIPRDVKAVRSLTLKDFTLQNPLPPSIDGVSLVSTGSVDSIELGFHYTPRLSISAEASVVVPYIGVVRVNLRVSLHSFRGHMRLFVPKTRGRAEIHILESTEIKCDLKAELGSLIKVETEAMNSIWQSILNWIHSYLHSKVIKIPLEEVLEEKPRQASKIAGPVKMMSPPKMMSPKRRPLQPRSPKWQAPKVQSPRKRKQDPLVKTRVFFSFRDYVF